MVNDGQTIEIELSISRDEYLKRYRGVASTVLAQTTQGITVRFPANRLQPFVRRDGVHGRFRLQIDSQNRLLSIEQLA